jgi:DNA-binding CsgD family transcriptional regulator
MGDETLPTAVKKISVAQSAEPAPKNGEPPHKTAAGFLLMDPLLHPAWFNAEAIKILSYPNKLVNLTRSEILLAATIRSSLVSQQVRGESPLVTEFRSGRRRYFCRPFFVYSYAQDSSHPYIAVLLERGPAGLATLLQISQQFNLTKREREALEYLLQGLSSNAIAIRMSISPNTVKALFRTIMIKTGASSRSAVLSKIIFAQPQ